MEGVIILYYSIFVVVVVPVSSHLPLVPHLITYTWVRVMVPSDIHCLSKFSDV